MTVLLRNTPVMEAQQDTTTPSVTGSWGGISPAAGDLLVCVVSYGTGNTALPALSGLTGWTVAVQATEASQDATWVYTRVAAGGDTAPTVSFTTGASAGLVGLMVTLYDLIDSSGATPVLYTYGTFTGVNTAPAPVTALAVPYAGCLGICGQTIQSGAGTISSWSAPSGWMQDGLTGLNASTGQCGGAVYHLPNPASGSTLAPAMYLAGSSYNAAFVLVVAPPALTTEFTPPQPPPGFLTPGSFPFQWDQFAPFSNDAPVPGAPYLIAQAAATAAIYALKPMTRTNPGDVILVTVTGIFVTSVTDTQGNTYAASTGTGGAQYAAVSSMPLGLSDSITVAGTAPSGRTGVSVIGIPAALAGSQGPFLVPGLSSYAVNAGNVTAVTTPAGVSVPAGAFIFAEVAVEGLAAGGVNLPQIPYGWTIIGQIQATTATYPIYIATVWRLNPALIPAGSTVLSVSNAGGNTAIVVSYTTFAPETRFASAPGLTQGAPSWAPPGMLSPAAFPFPNGPYPQQAVNDAPVPGAPYLLGMMTGGAAASSKTLVLNTASNAGDTIVVFTAGGNVAVTCADTEGNSYSFTVPLAGQSERAGLFTAVNPRPLNPGDSVTVTWASALGYGFTVIGVPGAPAGVPNGNLTPDATTTSSTGNGSTMTGTIAASSLANPTEVAVAYVMLASTGGPVSWPPDWAVISSGIVSDGSGYGVSAAYKVLASRSQIQATFLTAVSDPASGIIIATFMPETRFASQPGITQNSAPSPPGLMSPGAWPVLPQAPTTVNDVPFPPGSPYVIAKTVSSGVTATSYTFLVQNPSSRGDAIVVMVGATATGALTATCTDTQGNLYYNLGHTSLGNNSQFAAVNTNPLTAADSITLTAPTAADWGATVLGCPAAALGSSSWLVPFSTQSVSGVTAGGFATLLNQQGVLNGPVLLVAALGCNTWTQGVTLFNSSGYGTWNIVDTLYIGGPSTSIFAWRIVPGMLAASAIVAQITTAASGGSMMWTALIPETRFAPVGPHPDMPPGMTAPGAFLYQPLSPPEGPWSADYNSNYGQVSQALTAGVTDVPVITRQVQPVYSASVTQAASLSRGIMKALAVVLALSGKLTRKIARILVAAAALSGGLGRTLAKTVSASLALTARVIAMPPAVIFRVGALTMRWITGNINKS